MKRLALTLLPALFLVQPARAADPAPAGAAAPAPIRGAVPAPPRPLPKGSRQGNVRATRHNLSVTGPGQVKATSETRVCFFCHGSHGGGMGMAGHSPAASAAQISGYRSSTMQSRPMAASTGTRMCIGCHDGSLAGGETRLGMPAMRSGARLGAGLDLRRSHPVGVEPVRSATMRTPQRGEAVALDRRGTVECTSCHDPHLEDADPDGKFLVAQNQQSGICLSCHAVAGWGTGSHQNAARVVAGRAGAPRTVADLGCASCHVSHGAAERGPLLQKATAGTSDDDLCLSCHDGRTGANIAAEVSKPFAHSAARNSQTHDQAEGSRPAAPRLPETSPAAPRHVACADCHEPHAASGRPQRAPFAQGPLGGAWGVDLAGQRVASARYEYEVCLKCHGDSANKPQGREVAAGDPVRRAPEYNLRRVFDPNSPSFHPVAGPGRGRDVPSLIPPLSVSSVIYCSDCHSSESSGGSRGPHGSIHRKLLAAGLATRDLTPESPASYALCYRCHSREKLLSDASAFTRHRTHVVEDSAPCTACHNPHGVSARSGSAAANAHLIDFDVSIVKPNGAGQLEYLSTGARTGSCALSCHGVEHTHAQSGYSAAPPSAMRALMQQQRQGSPLRGPARPAPVRK